MYDCLLPCRTFSHPHPHILDPQGAPSTAASAPSAAVLHSSAASPQWILQPQPQCAAAAAATATAAADRSVTDGSGSSDGGSGSGGGRESLSRSCQFSISGCLSGSLGAASPASHSRSQGGSLKGDMCYTLAAADGSFVHAESLPALISRLPECGLQEGADGESSDSGSSSGGDEDMDVGEAAPGQEGGVEREGGVPCQLRGGIDAARLALSQKEGGGMRPMDVMDVASPAAQAMLDQEQPPQKCVPMEGEVQTVHWPWPGEQRGSLPLPFSAQHPTPPRSRPAAPLAFQPLPCARPTRLALGLTANPDGARACLSSLQPYACLTQLSVCLPADPEGARACLSALYRDSFPSLRHLALLGPEGWPLSVVWEEGEEEEVVWEGTEEAQPPPKWSSVWGTGVTQPLPTWPSWWGDEAVEHQP